MLATFPVTETAPAKVNLALHVTGRRPDGYHELESLVVFADVADELVATPAKRDSLRLGAVRLELLPGGAWQEWDRKRLARSGGTAEQYKHPCLIADPKFRATMPVEQELPV